MPFLHGSSRPAPIASRITDPSLVTDLKAYVDEYTRGEAPELRGFRNRLLNLRDMLRDFHLTEFRGWARAKGVMFQEFETIDATSLPLPPIRPSDPGAPAAFAWIGLPERDFGAYVGSEWRSGIAPDPLIAQLRTNNLLPTLFRRTTVLVYGTRYSRHCSQWQGL